MGMIEINGVQYRLDKNGYARSLLTSEDADGNVRCYLCGRTDRPLQRHELFGGALRDKSKAYGLWCCICDDCHLQKVHGQSGWAFDLYGRTEKFTLLLRAAGQRAAMREHNLTTAEFVKEFGKNYIMED